MIYAFEGHELDLRRYELRYAGKLVKIEPQVFNILLYLIQHRARVVSKDELLEQLWEHTSQPSFQVSSCPHELLGPYISVRTAIHSS